MFKNTFQSGFLSVLYSIGSKPLQIWDKKVRRRRSGGSSGDGRLSLPGRARRGQTRLTGKPRGGGAPVGPLSSGQVIGTPPGLFF